MRKARFLQNTRSSWPESRGTAVARQCEDVLGQSVNDLRQDGFQTHGSRSACAWPYSGVLPILVVSRQPGSDRTVQPNAIAARLMDGL